MLSRKKNILLNTQPDHASRAASSQASFDRHVSTLRSPARLASAALLCSRAWRGPPVPPSVHRVQVRPSARKLTTAAAGAPTPSPRRPPTVPAAPHGTEAKPKPHSTPLSVPSTQAESVPRLLPSAPEPNERVSERDTRGGASHEAAVHLPHPRHRLQRYVLARLPCFFRSPLFAPLLLEHCDVTRRR